MKGYEMVKMKIIAALALLVLVLVIVLQNTQPIETKLLFVTLTMPRAALLGLTMLIGIAIGILVALGLSVGKTKKD